MQPALSQRVQRTFQIISVIATVMVVAIHYQSAVPQSRRVGEATWNELLQEFLLGGVARVAVPLFALAAGLFYFRSDDGTWACYWEKLCQRLRTVGLPYFIVASLAMIAWLMIQRIKHVPPTLGWSEFASTWWLGPPAEQLWFLRDLLVLVTLAPVIRWMLSHAPGTTLISLGIAWLVHWQPTPLIDRWYLIHNETLFFFVLGGALVRAPGWLDGFTRLSRSSTLAVLAAWFLLVAIRVAVQPNFDSWYVSEYSPVSLLLHKSSILVGGLATFALAGRCRESRLAVLSGGAFFVFLVHEFPLRAVVDRLADATIGVALGHEFTFWFTAPLVVVGCFAVAAGCGRWLPAATSVLTGGRILRMSS